MRTLLLALLLSAGIAHAQDATQWLDKLGPKYDRDGDGQLSGAERAVMLGHLAAMRRGEPVADERPSRLAAPERLYKAEPGPLGWATARVSLPPAGPVTRELPVRATWPERGEGPFPILLWSHGAHGSADLNQPLVRHWASHGYVVLQASHPDSHENGIRPGDPRTFACWPQRPVEVSSMLDRLDALVQRIPALAGRCDATRVGAGGHSFGAGTTLLLGGVTAEQRGERRSFRDPRIACAVVLSGQGRGGIFPDASCYASLELPALVITGTKDDSGRTGEPWTWRVEPFTFATRGPKLLMVIDGAFHDFGGVSGLPPLLDGSGPLDGDHVRLVRSAATALYDAYLKRDPAALAFLASDAASGASGGRCRWEHRGVKGAVEGALDEALR